MALGGNELGKVNFTDSLVQAIFIIASLGIPLYGIREIAITKNNKDGKSKTFLELFFLQFFFSLPATICFFVAAFQSTIDHQLIWLGVVALLGNALTCEWFLQGSEAFLFIALRSISIRTIATFFIFLLIKNQNDYILYYAILCSSVALTTVLNLSVIFPKIRFSIKNFNPWQHLKKINWLYACYAVASFYAVIDSLLLGWLSTSDVVGYYSFGYRLVRMSSMLIPTLGLVFIPAIAFHHSDDNKKEMQNQIKISQELILFFGIPLSFAFLILAPEIVSIFGSHNFNRTTSVIEILSPVPLLFGFSHLTGVQILTSIKKEKIYFIFLVTGLLIDVASNIILIPLLQERAAALSNLIAEVFVAAGTFYYLRNRAILHSPARQIFTYLLPSLVLLPIVVGLRLLHLSSLPVLVLSVIISGTIYLRIVLKRSSVISNIFFLKRTL